VNEPKPDLSPLFPDDATLKARRAALVDAVGPGGQKPQPAGGWRWRGPRLALGAALAVAAIVTALLVSAGGDNPPAAFAVEPQEGGGVRIKVYSLEDAAGLERALAQAGIRSQVTWLPAGMACLEPHYRPSMVHLPGGGTLGGMTMEGPGEPMTIEVGSTQRWRERSGERRRGEIPDEDDESLANLNLDPEAFRPDQSVVISGSPVSYDGEPEGGSVAHFGIAEGPVEPCQPLPAPANEIASIRSPQGAGGGVRSASSQTPAVAEAADAPAGAPPAPGQFLYTKTKVVQLQGWEPDGPGAGSRSRPRYFTASLLGADGNALPALVPTLKEVWTARDGTTRERETLGRIEFLSGEDQRRWEDAGSPPPFAYDPAEHEVRRDSSGRLVKDFSSRSWRGSRVFSNVAKLSRLPTEPETLRLAIERRGGDTPVDPSPADSQRGTATAERLMEILREPITSPALRAAALNAFAELPGIEVEHDVADVAGRRGDAIAWVRERGFGPELVFDPRTAQILAEAEVIFKARAAGYPGVPDGTVFRETAYLRSGIVDSKQERPAR
jgi:hypothetical protein